MRSLLVSCLLAASCAGDDTIAVPTQLALEPVAQAAPDDELDGLTDPEPPGETPLDGVHEDVTAPPAEDATVSVSPPEEPDPPVEEEWTPDWVENAPDEIKGCLETFPLICDKVAECGETQPLLGLVAGFCPTLFDAINPVLAIGCEQVGPLLEQAVPGGIPFVGSISELVQKLLKGCIENFQCDPEYLAQFGETLAGIVQSFAESQQGGGQGDFSAALPALLDLANQCGGIGELLGIPFFGL